MIEKSLIESKEEMPSMRMAVEVEALLWDKQSKKYVTIQEAFGGNDKIVMPSIFSEITHDANRYSVELVSTPCATTAELEADLSVKNWIKRALGNNPEQEETQEDIIAGMTLKELIAHAKGEGKVLTLEEYASHFEDRYEFHYVSRAPDGAYGMDTDSPTYRAYLEALVDDLMLVEPDTYPNTKEGRVEAAKVVDEKTAPMGRWQSTQLHVEIDPVSEVGVSLINIFNASAVHMNRAVVEKFKIKNDDGHLDIYSDYANPNRFNPNHWFESITDMQKSVAKIPSLIKPTKTSIGSNVLHNGKPTHSELGNMLDEGAIWWPARPRKSLASENSHGTIEIRMFPSLNPKQIVELADDLRTVTEYLYKKITNIGSVATKGEADTLLRGLQSDLPKQAYLLPQSL